MDIKWYKGDSSIPLVSDKTEYIISTTMARDTELEDKTKQSTSNLEILKFGYDDVADYYCQVDYADPVLDDPSPEQSLTILGIHLFFKNLCTIDCL